MHSTQIIHASVGGDILWAGELKRDTSLEEKDIQQPRAWQRQTCVQSVTRVLAQGLVFNGAMAKECKNNI